MKTIGVSLSDEELVLLDGKCSEKVQADVDAAKNRLALIRGKDNRELWELIADIRHHGETHQKISFRYRPHHGNCRVCSEGGGYHVYKRTTKYHKKGDPKFDSPRLISAVDFDSHSVYVSHYVRLGCCVNCYKRYQEIIAEAIADVEAEISEKITGHPPKYRRYNNYKCTACGWTGSENQMLPLPCLIGPGTYNGKCPSCEKENLPFGGRVVEIDDGYTLVKVPKN